MIRLFFVLFWFLLGNVSANFSNETNPVSEEKAVPKSNVAVVCPLEYQIGLELWTKYRENQGFVIHIITEPEPQYNIDGNLNKGIQLQSQTSPEKIRQKIRELNKRIPLSALVLVGDGFPTESTPFGWRDIIPAARVPAKVIQKFGEEKEIASDSWFADLNDDSFPDIPVGRLPVQSSQELIELTQRIIDYESNIPSGNWQKRISLIAGLGGFSPILDHVIESTVRSLFSELLSNDFELTLTQANWKSIYCPNPLAFRQTTIERINEGALFWMYLGHGFHQGLDRLQTPKGYLDIFRFEDIHSIQCDYPPILFFFACYTGAFDAYEDSLAERIMIGPNSPIAVLAASRTSMPYGMSIFGTEMLREVSLNRCPSGDDDNSIASSVSQEIRLGQLIFNAKKRMVEKIAKISEESREKATTSNETGKNENFESENLEIESSEVEELKEEPEKGQAENFKQDSSTSLANKLKKRHSKTIVEKIDDLAKVFDPNPKQLGDQLEDHIHLFNLFGDPLLKIRFPEQIQFDAPQIAYASHIIKISGKIDLLNNHLNENAEKTFSQNVVDQNSPKVRIELVLPRNRVPVKKPDRKTFELTPETIKQYETIYAAANQTVIQSSETLLNNGCFSADFSIPEKISGKYILRVIVQNSSNIYVGSKELTVRPFDSTATRPSAFYENPD